MSVVLAIDAGTTGVRTYAVDEGGRPLRSTYREFPQHFPRPGWVEHDPEEIWDAVSSTLEDCVGQCAEANDGVVAIGITNQRETAVVWDRRDGRIPHRAIVWQDRRTAARGEELRDAGHESLVRELTGLVLDPYFTATKLEWLLTEGGVEPHPDLCFGTVDSWLLWKLTGGTDGGVHATEASNASRTMLFDIQRLAWSAELTALFGVPESCLAEVRPSGGRFGVTAEGTPLPTGVPISGILGDQQAALFGQACHEAGQGKNTYGTGSFVLLNAGTQAPEAQEGLLTTIAWGLHDEVDYALEAAIFVTGAAVQWLRDGLGIIGNAAETQALAESLDSNEGVYFVPALTGLGSPYWDPYARGTILGLTRGSGPAHFARAALEAIAYQTADAVRAQERAAGRPLTELKADGGAVANAWLMQFQADVLGVPVSVPEIAETTALGAAYLAGIAVGVWDVAEVGERWREAARYEPQMGADERHSLTAEWSRAVERARGWAGAESSSK